MVTVSEKDKGALSEVAYIEAEAVLLSEETEKEIAGKLAKGKKIADYAAFDISLYDEDGKEVQPEKSKEVSVSISGVSTNEDYTGVEIYHLVEKAAEQKTKRSGRLFAAPARLDEDAGEENEPVYRAEKITKGVLNQIETEEEISFTAESFSKYVVVFIKNPNDIEATIHVMGEWEEDGNTVKDELTWDRLENSSEKLLIQIMEDSKPVEIINYIGSNNMREFVPEGMTESFGYQYTTTDKEGINRIETIDWDTLNDISQDGKAELYTWYAPIGDAEIKVYVHINERNQDGDIINPEETAKTFEMASLQAGVLTEEKIQEALQEAYPNATDAYALDSARLVQNFEAWLKDPDGVDLSTVKSLGEIESFKVLAGNAFVKVEGTGQEYAFDTTSGEDDDSEYQLTVHLSFSVGHTIQFDITAAGQDSNPGNMVGDTSVDTHYRVVVPKGADISIPVKIAQGYTVKITNTTQSSTAKDDIDYDSAKEDNQVREHAIVFHKVTEDKNVEVVFAKLQKTFDASDFYKLNADGQLNNVNSGSGSYHGVTAWFSEDPTSVGTKIVEPTAYDDFGEKDKEVRQQISGNSFWLTMQLPADGTDHQPNDTIQSYVLNALSINGTNLELPVDPAGDGATSGSVSTQIKDQNGETLAIATVSVKKEATPNKNIKWKRTYTIHFSNVNGSLKITDGNARGDNRKELRFAGATEGVKYVGRIRPDGTKADYDGSNENLDVINSNQKQTWEIYAEPEPGYYISEISIAKDSTDYTSANLDGSWNGIRSLKLNTAKNPSGAESPDNIYTDIRFKVTASPISYGFKYINDKDNSSFTEVNWDDPNGCFTLSNTEGASAALNYVPTVQSYEEGGRKYIFQGWKLSLFDSEVYPNGSMILKETLLDPAISRLIDGAGREFFYLYPSYIEESQATRLPFTVSFYKDGKKDQNQQSITLYAAQGELLTLTKIRAMSEVAAVENRYIKDGFILDVTETGNNNQELPFNLNSSNMRIRLYYMSALNEIHIRTDGTDHHGSYYFYDKTHGDTPEDKQTVPEDRDFYGHAGEIFGLVIDADPGYKVSHVMVNNVQYPVQTVTLDGKEMYLIEFTVALDVNNLEVVYGDNPATREYSILFDTKGGILLPPRSGFRSGTKVQLTETTTKAGALFMGWTEDAAVPELIESKDVYQTVLKTTEVTIDGADKTVYAIWAADKDQNGKPDWEDGKDQESGDQNTDSSTTSQGSTAIRVQGTVEDPYIVGVHGEWVHVQPQNVLAPLREPVPENADPISSPQWHQWKFVLNNGTMLYDRWAYIYNPYAKTQEGQPTEGWFSFADNGVMRYGWYLDQKDNSWYYLHQTSNGMLGTMRKGWHQDEQDGRWYYLDPVSGQMQIGWKEINGKWYYFNPIAQRPTWSYEAAHNVWTFGNNDGRPFGSMYRNETTPDGYFVDDTGAWVPETAKAD